MSFNDSFHNLGLSAGSTHSSVAEGQRFRVYDASRRRHLCFGSYRKRKDAILRYSHYRG